VASRTWIGLGGPRKNLTRPVTAKASAGKATDTIFSVLGPGAYPKAPYGSFAGKVVGAVGGLAVSLAGEGGLAGTGGLAGKGGGLVG
jgi:hypothetical protein